MGSGVIWRWVYPQFSGRDHVENNMVIKEEYKRWLAQVPLLCWNHHQTSLGCALPFQANHQGEKAAGTGKKRPARPHSLQLRGKAGTGGWRTHWQSAEELERHKKEKEERWDELSLWSALGRKSHTSAMVIDWQRVLDAFAKELEKFRKLSMPNPWEDVWKQNFIVDFVYLALIVFLEPLRLVFGELRVIEHDDPPKDGNIYIRSTRTLVLRVFKTVRSFGEQSYDLRDSDLGEILERSLELYPRSHLVMQQKRSREHNPPCMGASHLRISYILRNLGCIPLDCRVQPSRFVAPSGITMEGCKGRRRRRGVPQKVDSEARPYQGQGQRGSRSGPCPRVYPGEGEAVYLVKRFIWRLAAGNCCALCLKPCTDDTFELAHVFGDGNQEKRSRRGAGNTPNALDGTKITKKAGSMECAL